MSKWIDLDLAERRVILQSVENKEKLQQTAAIEKDWWVTAVLKALFQTSCKEALKDELDARLKEMGVTGYKIEPVTERQTKDGAVHINSNTDPTVLLVHYPSVLGDAAVGA